MLWFVLWLKNRHFRISIALKLRDFDSKRRAIKTIEWMYRNVCKFDTYFFDILPYFRDFKDKLFFRFYGTSKRSSHSLFLFFQIVVFC